MISKYGEDSVSKIKRKDMLVGSTYIDGVIKTGITLADLPIVGPSYRYNHINKLDREDRRKLQDEEARRRY